MALEDLNPYGKAGLQSFQSRTLNSMDSNPDVPRVTDFYSNYGAMGTDQLVAPDLSGFARGIASAGQVNRIADIKEPSVGFNELTNQVFVNGLTFDADDYQTAERSASPEYLGRTPTGLPEGFTRLPPELYAEYIKDIKDPGKMRLMGKNFGIGVDNLQNFLYSGAAFLGDSIGSETISEFGREGIKQQTEDLRRKEPFQRTFTDDVLKEGEVIDWFLANLAQQGPNLLESMGAFLVGAGTATVATGNPITGVLTGVGAALGKGQFRKRIMNIVAKKRRGERLDQGDYALIKGMSGIAASIGNNYRTGVSDTYLQLLESAEMKDPGAGQRLAALGAGVPYALAETLSEAFVVSKFLNPAKASSTFRRIIGGFGAGAAAEGIAEGAQESTVMTTDALLNDKELFTEQNGIQLINAIAAGAAVGGPITGLSGLRKGDTNEVNLLDSRGVTDEGGGTVQEESPQGELFPDADLGTAPVPEGPLQGELFPPETDLGVGIQLEGRDQGNLISPEQAQLDMFDPEQLQNRIPSQQPGFAGLQIPVQQELPLGYPDPVQLDLPLPTPAEPETVTQSPPQEAQLPLPFDAPRMPRPDNIFVQDEPVLTPTVEEVTQPVDNRKATKKQTDAVNKFIVNPTVEPTEDRIPDVSLENLEGALEAAEANNNQTVVPIIKEAIQTKKANLKRGKRQNKYITTAAKPKAKALKKGKAEQVDVKEDIKKEEPDAVQEPETTQVDAQEQTQDGERVGEKVQETTRVRPKKESLKKGKVKKQSVQADTERDTTVNAEETKPKTEKRIRAFKRSDLFNEDVVERTFTDDDGVTRTQLIAGGRVVSDVAGPTKASSLKRGKRKVAPDVTKSETETTKKPQQVDPRNRKPVETLNVKEQWDANRPAEDAPKREDFPVNLRGELDKLTPQEARDVWTNRQQPDGSGALELLSDSVATKVIIYTLDNMKLSSRGVKSFDTQQMESLFQYLLDVSLFNENNKEGRDYLANFKLKRPEFVSAVTRVVPFALAQGNLNAETNTLWFDVAVNVGALPSLKRLLKTDASYATYNQIESATFSSEQIIENNIETNEVELTSFGGMSAAIYSDKTKGPVALARKMAVLIGTIKTDIIKSENSPAVQQLNRLYQGTSKVKPDLTYEIDGKPLSMYFDASGKLKLRPHNTYGINRLGKEYPINGFKLSPVTMEENRILNLMASNITQEDKVKARKELEDKELSVQERETFESMLSGYMGEKNQALARDMVNTKQVKLFNPKSKGTAGIKLKKGEVSTLDTELVQDTDLNDIFADMGIAEKGNTLLFDDDKPVKVMTVGKAKLLARNMLSKFTNKPNLTVAKDLADLQQVNPELYNRIIAARPDVENKMISGMSIGKEIAIFSDYIHGEQHLKFTLAHEAMGHFGLRSLVKDSQLKAFLDNIYNTSPFLKDSADLYMETHKVDKYVAIEEAMANYVGALETSTVAKIANFIQKILNKLGVKNWMDSAPYWVNQLRRYVRDGEIPGGVSPKQIALNVEALATSNVGMFSAANINLASDSFSQLYQSVGESNMNSIVKTIGSRKLTENIGRAAEQVQTLDNMANKSLGLSLMFDIFRRQAQTAKSILSEVDHMTRSATRARWLGLNSKALTSDEEVAVGRILAFGHEYFKTIATESKLKEYGDIVIQDPLTKRPILNQPVLAQALAETQLTDDQIKNGFEYEQGGVNQPTGPLVPDWDPENNERHALMREVYLAQREGLNYIQARVALGKYLGAIRQYEANRDKIQGLSDQFTAADMGVFAEIQEVFSKLYQANARQSDGKMRPTAKGVRDSEAFLNGMTRALWQSEAVNDLKAMKSDDSANESRPTQLAINIINEWNQKNPDDQIDMTNMVSGLERMNKYDLVDPNKEGKPRDQVVMDLIQKPIKNQIITETQLMNANVFAKQGIFAGYTPIKRRGKKQLRFQMYDENGNPTKIDPRFSSAFPYYQDDNPDKLAVMAKDYNEAIKDTVFEVPVSGKPDETVTQKVKAVAIVEDTSGGTSSVTSFNYDEFANVLNTLGIDIDPIERERIVVALTRQHEKARNTLMKDFVQGFDKDVFRSIAESIESQAAIAAKNEHRTDIDIVMADTNNWQLPKKYVDNLYQELLAAREGDNKEATMIAQERFDRMLRMYIETAGESPGSPATEYKYVDKYGKEQVAKTKGKGNRYKDKAAELLEFYTQQGDIAVSAEDAFSKSDTLSQFKSMAVLFQLGGSIAAGLINLVSQPLMALPLMATYNTKTGIGGGYGWGNTSAALSRANWNLKWPGWGDPDWIKKNVIDNSNYGTYGLSEDEAQFIYRQTKRGILDAALVNSLAGRARGNFFQNGTATAVSRGYMSVFATAEQLNRRAVALATYRLEKKRRMAANPNLKDGDFLVDDQLSDVVIPADNPDLYYIEDKVNEMVTKSQGDYAMYNRPPIARGGWAQYLYMYKQFQVIATQIVRVLPPQGRVYYLTALFLAAGLKGLPGAEDLLDIVDTLRAKFGGLVGAKGSVPTEVQIANFLSSFVGTPEFYLRGAGDYLAVGGTIGSRLSLGDLFPLTGVFLPGSSTVQELKNFAGPLFAAGYGGATMAYDLAMLPTKSNKGNELMRIAQNSPIAGLRNIADTAIYLDTGDVINARGYTVVKDVGTGATVMRFLGFYPKEASRVNDAIRITKRIVDNQKEITKSFRDEWVRAFLMKDRRAMRDIERAVKEHNSVHGKKSPFFIDDFRGKAKRAAKSASEGAGARFLKTTPKSTRDNVSDLIENFYGVSLN